MKRNLRVIAYAFVLQYVTLLALGLYAVSMTKPRLDAPRPRSGPDIDLATRYVLLGRVSLFASRGFVEIIDEYVDAKKGVYSAAYFERDGAVMYWEVELGGSK